uniref:peptide deformylase n=1 Tax=Brugia malayi TaxID=6279 RepID=A0A0J9Y820_BRUMA|nr:Bm9468 [Brugia malayi]
MDIQLEDIKGEPVGYECTEGFGLAAVQIGVLERIFVMDIQLEDIKGEPVGYECTGKFCMINPEITEL